MFTFKLQQPADIIVHCRVVRIRFGNCVDGQILSGELEVTAIIYDKYSWDHIGKLCTCLHSLPAKNTIHNKTKQDKKH